MNSIIDLIYDNDIFRITDKISLSAEYKSAADRLCAAEKQLLERFPECAEIYDEYQDAQIEVTIGLMVLAIILYHKMRSLALPFRSVPGSFSLSRLQQPRFF